MRAHARWWRRTATLALIASATLALAAAGCSGDDDDGGGKSAGGPVVTQVSTPAAATAAPATATPAGSTAAPAESARRIEAATATITLDGRMDDWEGIPGLQVPLTAIPEALREDPTAGADVTATLKIATDGSTIFVLLAVPDGYDYDPGNLHRSPAIAIEWLVDEGAGPGMGTSAPDYDESGGMVDIWHWELDCGPGDLSGGSFPSGNDPNCNLDDEYATLTDEREDDDSESSLTGSWDHTARAGGIGADGTFVFEIARPMETGDAQDAQFTAGASALVAVAYWDGNEGREKDGGWTDAGHVTSALDGWIEVLLPK